MVHCGAILQRTCKKKFKRYKSYAPYLEKDFSSTCGYCGKKKQAVSNSFFCVDHFEPKERRPDLSCVYSNMVYSCFVCNNKKSDKWPTQKDGVSYEGNIGIVDPVSPEYTEHLMRDEKGAIVPKNGSKLGKYMIECIFEFDTRPIADIYKYMKLRNELIKTTAEVGSPLYKECFDLCEKLKKTYE